MSGTIEIIREDHFNQRNCVVHEPNASWHWRHFGSLDSDEALLERLRKCCEDRALGIQLGYDGLDIYCRNTKEGQESAHDQIAYGMFCMCQTLLDD